MKVFVAGGSGAVGTRLIPHLVTSGHQVVASTRTQANLAALKDAGAQPVLMDGLDKDSVRQAVMAAKPDALIHVMTALKKLDFRHVDRSFALTNQLWTVGTANLLAGARAAGTQRILMQSFAGWPYEKV